MDTGIELIRSIGRDKLAELFGHNTRYTAADDERVAGLINAKSDLFNVTVTANIVKQARLEFGMKSFEKGAEPEPAPPAPDLFTGAFPELAELRKIADTLTIMAADVRGLREDMAKTVNA